MKNDFYKNKYGTYYKYYYIANIKKYQKFYTELFIFETELQDAISNVISQQLEPDWIKSSLFKKYAKKHITLGFWVECFNKDLVRDFWLKNKNLIKNVFPHFTKLSDYKFKTVREELFKIKNFRNKVFHFEIDKISDQEIKDCKTLIAKYIKGITNEQGYSSNPAILMKTEAVNYIKKIQNIEHFEVITKNQKQRKERFKEIESAISSLIDCTFDYNGYKFYVHISFLANQGGSQNAQFNEIINFLNNARDCHIANNIFIAICDGDFYLSKDTETNCESKLDRLERLTDSKTTFVKTINQLPNFLQSSSNI